MKSPKWGPGFQSIDSNLYRAEYAGLFLGILVYLVWKGAGLAGGAATIYWSSFVFWLILPDVASFIPIGLLSKGGRWPSWGARLYNTFHSAVVCGLVFVSSWLFLQTVYLPVLAWFGHIAADRTVGYYLRSQSATGQDAA